MKLHPLAEQFGSVAGAYQRGRPEYAPAVVGALGAELGLAPGARVLDLAAGTGKLTRALQASGYDVVAVEPQAELRELLSESVGADRVLDGVAEAIPLPEGSVDAVTVADGFHWFDRGLALREIRRVLRPAGGLAILTMIPDWADASWAPEVGRLMRELRPEHPHFDGPPWQEFVAQDGGWGEPREVRITTKQPARDLLAYIESFSWIAAMGEEQRRETVSRVASLIEADGTVEDTWGVHVIMGLAQLP